MSGRVRRRRALLLLSLALACGGLSASQVRERARAVEARVGRPVPVMVAARDLPADRRLRRGDLALRQVPERFVPRDSLASGAELQGARTSVPVAAGGYLTAGTVEGAGRAGEGAGVRGGERAVGVAVAGGDGLSGASGPGARVDVLISTEARDGAGRTFLALEDVELLSLRPAGQEAAAGPSEGAAEGAAAAATALATLRVSARQAVYLTAAQNFAKEVRLLGRPAGDRRRLGRAAVEAAGL